MPLMMILYWIQFMDKTTLGSSAILGIREANHLTTNQCVHFAYRAHDMFANYCVVGDNPDIIGAHPL